MKTATLQQRRQFAPNLFINSVPGHSGAEYASWQQTVPGVGTTRFCVQAYSGKRGTPDLYQAYSTRYQRDKALNSWKDGLVRRAEEEKQKRNRRVLAENPVRFGDIFVASWGYDQTNVNFYQVIKVRGSMVDLREIGHQVVTGTGGNMSANVTAVPNEFLRDASKTITKRVSTYDNGKTVYLSFQHSNAHPWDGKPRYSSWYA